MDLIIVSNLNEKKCMLCGRNYTHRKIFYRTSEEGLKEMECLTTCATCRNLLKRKKVIDNLLEERKTLAKIRVHQEWKEFINNLSE